MKKLIDRLQGKPFAVRWVAVVVLVWPVIAARYVLIGVLAVLWAWNAPQVAVEVLNTIARAEAQPNERRTPKKRRPWPGLDDFDDVRVRVSELTQ